MLLGEFLLREIDLVPTECAARAAVDLAPEDADAASLLARIMRPFETTAGLQPAQAVVAERAIRRSVLR